MVGIVRNNESCVQISDAESPRIRTCTSVSVEANTVTVPLYQCWLLFPTRNWCSFLLRQFNCLLLKHASCTMWFIMWFLFPLPLVYSYAFIKHLPSLPEVVLSRPPALPNKTRRAPEYTLALDLVSGMYNNYLFRVRVCFPIYKYHIMYTLFPHWSS